MHSVPTLRKVESVTKTLSLVWVLFARNNSVTRLSVGNSLDLEGPLDNFDVSGLSGLGGLRGEPIVRRVRQDPLGLLLCREIENTRRVLGPETWGWFKDQGK